MQVARCFEENTVSRGAFLYCEKKHPIPAEMQWFAFQPFCCLPVSPRLCRSMMAGALVAVGSDAVFAESADCQIRRGGYRLRIPFGDLRCICQADIFSHFSVILIFQFFYLAYHVPSILYSSRFRHEPS